jgi:hypothetical protein
MLRRGYRAKLTNDYMHLSSATELDTAKVVRFPSAQLTLMQCGIEADAYEVRAAKPSQALC